jgi:hypothetical protein
MSCVYSEHYLVVLSEVDISATADMKFTDLGNK